MELLGPSTQQYVHPSALNALSEDLVRPELLRLHYISCWKTERPIALQFWVVPSMLTQCFWLHESLLMALTVREHLTAVVLGAGYGASCSLLNGPE